MFLFLFNLDLAYFFKWQLEFLLLFNQASYIFFVLKCQVCEFLNLYALVVFYYIYLSAFRVFSLIFQCQYFLKDAQKYLLNGNRISNKTTFTVDLNNV